MAPGEARGKASHNRPSQRRAAVVESQERGGAVQPERPDANLTDFAAVACEESATRCAHDEPATNSRPPRARGDEAMIRSRAERERHKRGHRQQGRRAHHGERGEPEQPEQAHHAETAQRDAARTRKRPCQHHPEPHGPQRRSAIEHLKYRRRHTERDDDRPLPAADVARRHTHRGSDQREPAHELRSWIDQRRAVFLEAAIQTGPTPATSASAGTGGTPVGPSETRNAHRAARLVQRERPPLRDVAPQTQGALRATLRTRSPAASRTTTSTAGPSCPR